ncbi:hypothetical protein Syun_031927 [Stephania yunnanensis]|uniref:Uncharacterized protein n=1 Tax=Stephania yunnanensis TaxID=152371 RepID=A0AAP0HDR7_9MAGN
MKGKALARPDEGDLHPVFEGHTDLPSSLTGTLILNRRSTPEEGPRKSRSKSVPDRQHAVARSRRGAASSSPPRADGFGLGPRAHPRANPFPGYGSILPTSLAYILPSTAGRSPWRPDAVMSTTGANDTRSSGFSRAAGAHRHHQRAVLFQPPDPTSAEPFPGWAVVKRKR